MKRGPKIVVIGAGSLFFGRQAIWQACTSEHLNGGTLALVDTDRVNLARMRDLALKAVAHSKAGLRIEADSDAGKVLKEADFVVLSFADRSVRFRGIDCEVALKYGIRMCSGDTIGPGGIFRTLREFPKILEYCRLIERICPDAWVINYINPTAANGIGIRLFAPKLRSFALCDGLHMPHVKRNYAIRAGIIRSPEGWNGKIDRDFDFRIAGPNHFTWLLKAEYKGRDVSPEIARKLAIDAAKETDGYDKGAKTAFNNGITHRLHQIFGFVPTCTGHTKEYLRFWQGLGRKPEPIPPLAIWETGDRYETHAQMWSEVDSYNLGVAPMREFFGKHKPDHATDIIETMWAGLKKPFFINTANKGAVPNMPDDAFLEMLCDVDMDGPRPRPVGDAPVGLRGLWSQVLDSHQLSAEAAVSCNRETLLRAFVCDPLVSSIEDSRAMMEELLAREKDALPGRWLGR